MNKTEVITKSGRRGVTFQRLKEAGSSQDAQTQSSPGKTVTMKALFVFLGLALTAALSRSDQAAVFPEDCTKVFAQKPHAKPGVYVIQPSGNQTRFRVYCERYPGEPGWTVIQRRTGGLVQFIYRTWAEYKHGFGTLTYDHWLGLDKIHALTKDTNKVWTLRVDLWGHKGGERGFAEYQDFRIGDEGTAYRLHIGTYRGNVGDAIHGAHPGADQNGTGFRTIDRENNCPLFPIKSRCVIGNVEMDKCSDGGGWWYNNCGSAALNGEWHSSWDPYDWYSGIYWLTWKPGRYSLMISRLMIRSD